MLGHALLELVDRVGAAEEVELVQLRPDGPLDPTEGVPRDQLVEAKCASDDMERVLRAKIDEVTTLEKSSVCTVPPET